MQVERTPDAIAVVFQDEQLTYEQLNHRANQLAHHLRALGVGPEVPVGICLKDSLEIVVGLLGTLKAGGVYVPLDPAYPKERIAFMLEDAKVPVILTEERLLTQLPEHSAKVVCLDSDREAIAQEKNCEPRSARPFCEPGLCNLYLRLDRSAKGSSHFACFDRGSLPCRSEVLRAGSKRRRLTVCFTEF